MLQHDHLGKPIWVHANLLKQICESCISPNPMRVWKG